MSLGYHRYMTVDPGLVSGAAIIAVYPDGASSFSTFEIEGGPEGLIEWMLSHRPFSWTAIAVEDFLIRQNTGKMTQEDVRYAMLGTGMARTAAYQLLGTWDDVHMYSPGEHKTYSGVNGPKAGNKVLQAGLAEKTPDGHAMDAASLGLRLLNELEPVAFDILMEPLL